MTRVFEVTTDPSWVPKIVAAAIDLDVEVRCNQTAAQSGRTELTYPNAIALKAYMEAGGDDVIVAYDGNDLDGYLIVRDLEGRCQGKWVGVFNHAEAAPIYRGLLDAAVERYGPIHGRITNDSLREWLRETMPGRIDPDDPQIIHYPGG